MGNELVKQDASYGMGRPASGQLSVFSNADSFNLAQRMANALAQSTIVPKAYQNNAGNCMIAIEMASRINTSPMMVMQNLYIVNGNPAWSSQWIIAMINASGRYKTELQFEFGDDPADGGMSCRAYVEDFSGHTVYGPKITMKMADAEGWANKSGSKWKTMPEVMIRYRAASFFGRVNCPDMIMGIYSQDEVLDMGGVPEEVVPAVNPMTGEVVDVDFQEENRVITQEERKILINLAQSHLGKKDGNEFLIGTLKALGYESSHEVKKRDYDEIMRTLLAYIETTEKEKGTQTEAQTDAQEEMPLDG